MKLHLALFIYLVFGFILATVIGTLSHEGGHWLAAELLGYDAAINYQSMWPVSEPLNPGPYDHVYITLGGPVQTIVTGTIGLILLLARRKSIRNRSSLTIGQWVLVFLALFWLRPTFNTVTWILHGFSGRGDEIRLAKYFDWPYWSVLVGTGLVGLLVLVIVTFRFIPVTQRFTFLVAGLTGGLAGFFFWLEWFGEMILP